MTFKTLALTASLAALTLAACGKTETPKTSVKVSTPAAAPAVSLDDVLAAQPEDMKARYQYRNPKETLAFFGLEPGMTVAEALPGGGWYSKIILPYIGDEGALIGVDYSLDMWPEFGGFANAEFIAKKKEWPATWMKSVEDWRGDNSAALAAFTFGGRDASMDGKVDAVLFIRALHNLARFEDKGNYMTQAVADTHALLKPGGIVGVVQHRAPADASGKLAGGSAGYLREADVIAAFEKAGFKLAASSEINANPKDKPGADDIVWRLPPSLRSGDDDAELKAKMMAIGESDRMTLKFVKK